MAVPTITIIGNLGTDPELRTGASGNAYVRVFVIASSRQRNRQTGEWEDGDHVAIGGVAFGDLAQHISQSLSKGMRVIVQGRLRESRPNPTQPDARGSIELLIDDMGPALSNATAQVTKVTGGFAGNPNNRGGFAGAPSNDGFGGGYQGGAAAYTGGAGYQQPAQPSAPAAPMAAPAADPWNTAAPAGDEFTTFGGTSDFGGGSDEPEF